MILEFTPLEFETHKVSIYQYIHLILEFTPLEFEAMLPMWPLQILSFLLEFTPLEFETKKRKISMSFRRGIRIYSVGVWNLQDISRLETYG